VAAITLIAPKLKAFFENYPGIQLELAIEDGFVDIVREGYDAGIRLGERVHRDMVGVPISKDLEHVVCGSPEYFSRHGVPASVDDLADHACVTWRGVATRELYRWEMMREGVIVEVDVKGPLIVNDVDVAVRAAQDGLGLVCTTRDLVEDRLNAGALITVLDDANLKFPCFYLYYPAKSPPTAAVRAFAEFMRIDVGV
jgi:DNA-binding transcriptional LysR family regulator